MKRNKALSAIGTVVSILLALHFLCIDKYTTETLLTAFLFVCCAIGCILVFGIESDKE